MIVCGFSLFSGHDSPLDCVETDWHPKFHGRGLGVQRGSMWLPAKYCLQIPWPHRRQRLGPSFSGLVGAQDPPAQTSEKISVEPVLTKHWQELKNCDLFSRVEVGQKLISRSQTCFLFSGHPAFLEACSSGRGGHGSESRPTTRAGSSVVGLSEHLPGTVLPVCSHSATALKGVKLKGGRSPAVLRGCYFPRLTQRSGVSGHYHRTKLGTKITMGKRGESLNLPGLGCLTLA